MIAQINQVILQIDVYLATFGLLSCLAVVCCFAAKICRAIRLFLIQRLFLQDLTFYGEWAVVTGGSSGIGKSYARQLARRGMNIFLISRGLDSLKLVADEIEREYRVQCRYIEADLTQNEVYGRLMKELENKNIGILINGAGIIGRAPCYFTDETEKNILAMIDLHIRAVMNMTMKVLPLMLAKKKGVIVNISSLASLYPTVLLSVYSSSKAFSDRFTRALSWEYSEMSDNDLIFQSLNPSFVNTNISKRLPIPSVIKMLGTESDDFAASAVSTITSTDHTTGYWSHEILWFFAKYIPSAINKFCLFAYHKFVAKYHYDY